MSSTSRSIGTGSQVGLDHGRVGLDLGRPALGDLAAEVEHGDAVADAHHQAHVVLDEQHGRTAVADLADELLQGDLLRGVHARGRLVQHQQPGLGGEGPGDLEAALIPVGEVLGHLAGDVGDADERQQVAGHPFAVALLGPVPWQPQHGARHAGAVPGVGADHDVVQRGHVGEEPDVLEGAGQAQAGDLVGPAAGQVDTGEAGLALGRLIHVGEDVERRRLARPVRTDQGEDLALVDVQVELGDRHDPAEADGQVAQLHDPSRIVDRDRAFAGEWLRAGRRAGRLGVLGNPAHGEWDAHERCSSGSTATSAPMAPMPPWPSAISARRWRDGSNPEGRKIITMTRAPPKISTRRSEKSCVWGRTWWTWRTTNLPKLAPRRYSGSQATMKAPRMTPGMLPEPPSTTEARISTESRNWKLSGVMAICFEANITPAMPPMDAPIPKAHSLNLKVGTPMSSAASSSSRRACQARPTRLCSSLRPTKMTTMMRTRTR